MGSRCCLLTETFLLLLSLMTNRVSSSRVCPVAESSSFLLNDTEVLLVPDTEDSLSQDVVLQRCGIEEHFELNFKYIKEMGYFPNYFKDDHGQKWFKVMYTFIYGMLFVRVESLRPFVIMGAKNVDKLCVNPVYNVTTNTPVKLAKLCDIKSDDSDALFSSWADGLDDGNQNAAGIDEEGEDDDEGMTNEDETSNHYLKKWLELEDDDDTNNYRSSFRGGHIIFIPVGAMIFLLSVCLRCCLCQRRKVVQRVRNITIVRRVPIATTSDFVHVTEPTAPDPTDLPPSYADIEDELPPPAYSELESVNVLSETPAGGGGREETQHITDTSPSSDTSLTQNSTDAAPTSDGGMTLEGDLSETQTRSVLSRVLTTGSRRNIKSQFSFKTMKNEDE